MVASATRELGELLASLSYSAMPPEAIAMAKRCILDFLGAALMGSRSEAGRIVADLLAGAGGAGEATIFGHTQRVPALSAALVNGTTGHALEIDDYYVVGYPLGHLATVTVPAAFALIEHSGHGGGQALIEAVIVGYEAAVRVSDAVGPYHYGHGWHATGTIGSFGAAAAAGKVLGLDGEQMANCLGLAGTQAAGLIASFSSYGKPLHAGKAAHAGVLSALLTERGYKGTTTLLEARSGFAQVTSDHLRPEHLLRPVDGDWAVLKNSFKLYFTACFDVADAILTARRVHGLLAEDVEEVRFGSIADFVKNQVGLDPRTVTAAKTSTQYVAAVALLDGAVGIDQFTEERLLDPAVRALMRRVTIERDAEVERLVRDGHYSVRLTVTTKAGRRLEVFLPDTRGHYRNPVSLDELQVKFGDLASRVIGRDRAEQVIGLVGALEEEPTLSRLADLLRPAADTSSS
ncbi:MAG: MmgE/PrpD family protein [Chloroflexi bacterium]|nr:MmgE/PrpD family protein [Chloroflexota bacterium]